MEQILLAYDHSKDSAAAKMILYKNVKAMVRSHDGNANFFDIIAGILQGDTLASSMFVICLDYVVQMSIDLIKRNWFHNILIKKKKDKKNNIPQNQ